jgi:hypothetical protein
LCGDLRIFDDLKKVPQVFRNPGGSPLLKMDDPKSRHTGMNAYSTRAIECSDFSDLHAIKTTIRTAFINSCPQLSGVGIHACTSNVARLLLMAPIFIVRL